MKVRQVNATKHNLLIKNAGVYVGILIKITNPMVALKMMNVLHMMIQVILTPTKNPVVIKACYQRKTQSLREQVIQIKTMIGMLILQN